MDKNFCMRFSMVKTTNFQKPFLPLDSWVSGQQKRVQKCSEIPTNFSRSLMGPLQKNKTHDEIDWSKLISLRRIFVDECSKTSSLFS